MEAVIFVMRKLFLYAKYYSIPPARPAIGVYAHDIAIQRSLGASQRAEHRTAATQLGMDIRTGWIGEAHLATGLRLVWDACKLVVISTIGRIR